jgi:hypothetical protein
MPTTEPQAACPGRAPCTAKHAGPHRHFRLAARVMLAIAIAGASGEAHAAQLSVSWTDNSDGTAATRLERRLVDNPEFTPIADVPPGVTQHVDAALNAETTYCYRAIAYSESGVSDYSAEACGTSPSEAVLSVTVKNIGDGMVVSAPEGLLCGAKCSASYPASTVLTLIPLPATGSEFIGWSDGPCSGLGLCIITGNTTVVVTATFGSLGALADATKLMVDPAASCSSSPA